MIVSKVQPVLLVGGAAVAAEDIRMAHNLCGPAVAADGGAMRLIDAGVTPDWLVGDFDSVTPEALATVPAARRLHVTEQETTDFEKALRRIEAPALLCLGFAGERIDHELAVYSALVRHPAHRAVILGGSDLCFHAQALDIDLPAGSRLSLFPMAPVVGRSEGLFWPIDGLDFAPGGRIGTSNRVTGGRVRLAFEGPGMLVILPKEALPSLWAAWGLAGG